MKRWTSALVGALALAAAVENALAYVDHLNAKVDKVQASLPDTNCFYFTLQGVTQADPVVPGQWFAIHKSQAHAADQYAMLLAAKLSDAPVRITTSGAIVCGYAGVRYMILE